MPNGPKKKVRMIEMPILFVGIITTTCDRGDLACCCTSGRGDGATGAGGGTRGKTEPAVGVLAVASPAAGTRMEVPHLGHLVLRPANSSCTEKLFAHLGHLKETMGDSLEG